MRYVYSSTNFNPNREKRSRFIYFSGIKVKYIKDTLNASDEDIERFLSMPFKELQIHTIDPKTGERIGYLFDSQRCIAKGTGRLEGNKEIMEWEWSGTGQGATSVSITPWAPFNKARLKYRHWRDYSGGGMTDWGCHGFGGALFCCGLHRTGAVEIIPPDGKDVERLTYKFANGARFYHGGGWGGMISIRGSKGETPKRGVDKRSRQAPPDIHIPNYKGRGGIFSDFIHCVRTREEPFRDIETVHRTATHCHLGNIAYWLKRPLKWDPEKEKFINDPEANRWLERPKRGQWGLF